ncbi:MAG: DUF192 domain-containing protein [Candidatus Margulisiibacteriota bacterium]
MFKKHVVALVLMGVLAWGTLVKASDIKTVTVGRQVFAVELAQTSAERAQGLMNRKSLAKNKGMLFVFEAPGFYPFWMKDTLISLDMLWIDDQSKIVSIKHGAKPLDETPIFPSANARYVLEIQGGLAKQLHLQVGQTVQLGR